MSYPPPPAGPTPGGFPGGQTPPDNYLVWAILTTVLCCLPFGIVSIIFSTQVNSKFAQGDFAGAHESSRKAKTWAIAAGVTGLVVGVIYAIIMVLSFGALASLDYSDY